MSIGTMSAVASAIASPSMLSVQDQRQIQIQHIGSGSIGLMPSRSQFKPITCAIPAKQASAICATTLSARCAAEQTQTVTRQSSTITVAPIQGKEKSPELDDGGTGFPPSDDGDGGGGGGGGGGNWSGGFFFFGFLAFLGFLKDQESEGPYRDKRR